VVLVKVTRNYQITIPAEFRKRLGIKEGDVLSLEMRGDTIIVRKVVRQRRRIRLGKKLYPEDIERGIDRGSRECVQ